MGREAAPKDAVIQPYPHPPHTAAELMEARRVRPPQLTARSLTPGSRVDGLPRVRDSQAPYNRAIDSF